MKKLDQAERRLAELLVSGTTRTSICASLGIASRTLDQRRQRLSEKLGAKLPMQLGYRIAEAEGVLGCERPNGVVAPKTYQVAQLALSGMANPEIAALMEVSLRQVEVRTAELRKMVNASNPVRVGYLLGRIGIDADGDAKRPSPSEVHAAAPDARKHRQRAVLPFGVDAFAPLTAEGEGGPTRYFAICQNCGYSDVKRHDGPLPEDSPLAAALSVTGIGGAEVAVVVTVCCRCGHVQHFVDQPTREAVKLSQEWRYAWRFPME